MWPSCVRVQAPRFWGISFPPVPPRMADSGPPEMSSSGTAPAAASDPLNLFDGVTAASVPASSSGSGAAAPPLQGPLQQNMLAPLWALPWMVNPMMMNQYVLAAQSAASQMTVPTTPGEVCSLMTAPVSPGTSSSTPAVGAKARPEGKAKAVFSGRVPSTSTVTTIPSTPTVAPSWRPPILTTVRPAAASTATPASYGAGAYPLPRTPAKGVIVAKLLTQYQQPPVSSEAPPPPSTIGKGGEAKAKAGKATVKQAVPAKPRPAAVSPQSGNCRPERYQEAVRAAGLDVTLPMCGMYRPWRYFCCNYCWRKTFHPSKALQDAVYPYWARMRDTINREDGLVVPISWSDSVEDLPLTKAKHPVGVLTARTGVFAPSAAAVPSLLQRWRRTLLPVLFLARLRANIRWRRTVQEARRRAEADLAALNQLGLQSYMNALARAKGLVAHLESVKRLWSHIPPGSEHSQARKKAQTVRSGDPPFVAFDSAATSSRLATLTCSSKAASSSSSAAVGGPSRSMAAGNVVTEGTITLRPAASSSAPAASPGLEWS